MWQTEKQTTHSHRNVRFGLNSVCHRWRDINSTFITEPVSHKTLKTLNLRSMFRDTQTDDSHPNMQTKLDIAFNAFRRSYWAFIVK